MFVDFDLFKAHVRADDFAGDDMVLAHYLQAAEEHTANVIGRPLRRVADHGRLPKPIEQAILLLAGHWYNQREAVGFNNQTPMPYGYAALVKPFIKL